MIYLYAFFTLSFLNALKDISIKRWLQKVDSWIMTGIAAIPLILISSIMMYIEGVPSNALNWDFVWIVLAGGVFYYFGKYFNFQALSLGDISYIAPLKSLVTLSVIVTSFLLLGETISTGWAIGILLIFLGTYFLALEKTHTKILSPLLALWSNPGSRMFLIATTFYGFTVTFDRMGILRSSLWVWTFAMNVFMVVFSLRDMYHGRAKIVHLVREHSFILSSILSLHALIYISQMWIVSQVLAPYTSSFKSASALFTVILGWWYFSEKDRLKRFLAACVILIWVICVSFLW